MSFMKNFKDVGYFEDYDSCYFQYRKAHRGVPWPALKDWEESIIKVHRLSLGVVLRLRNKALQCLFLLPGHYPGLCPILVGSGAGRAKGQDPGQPPAGQGVARRRYHRYPGLQRHCLFIRYQVLHRSACFPENRREIEIDDQKGLHTGEAAWSPIFHTVLHRH